MKKNRHHRMSIPLSREELYRQLEDLSNSLANTFHEHGHLNPGFAVLRSGKEPVLLSDSRFASRAERASQWRQLERLLERDNVAIVHALEGWYVKSTKTPSAPLMSARPSQHPDRQEGLVITGKWRGGAFGWNAKISRVNGKPTLGEWVKMNEMDELVAYPDDGPTIPTFDGLVESAMNDLQQRPHILYQLWIEECYKRAGLNRDEWNRMPKAQQLQIIQNHVPNDRNLGMFTTELFESLRREWSRPLRAR